MFEKMASSVYNITQKTFNVKGSGIYRPRGGGSYTIEMIFQQDFQQVDPDTDVVIASNQPAVTIKLSDLPDRPKKKDQVVVKNVEYNVIDSQEDGIGGATLFLHRTSSKPA